MPMTTADLCDQYGDDVAVAAPIFRSYGGVTAFGGPITTLRLFEDNVLVRTALSEPGQGRVLVVDGGGSQRCALVGDQLARLAVANGWAGIVVHGCIRDAAAINELALGMRALNTHPRRSAKLGAGERDEPVTFANVTFRPGAYLYADADGIVVANRPLLPADA